MSLSDIPTGASVMVEANVLIYARRGMSSQGSLLLKRCAKREINGALATVTIVEFCHRRMMQEAQAMGLTGSNPAQSLSQQPGLVRQLTQYARDIEDLLAGEFTILGLEIGDFSQAIQLQRQHGLLTNDALFLAAGMRSGINILVTADPQFDIVPGITVHKPDDL